jgi:CSLREA domain-containing protein
MLSTAILGILGWIERAKGQSPKLFHPTSSKLQIFLFIVAGFAFVALPASAFANTYTVTTVADHAVGNCNAADCTLREAVEAANANNGDDTIVFTGGLAGTITLQSDFGGQLLITDGVTITGPGARILSVSGNGTSRVFQINPVLLGGPTTVNISGLTVTGGNGAINTLLGLPITPGPGGGILNTGGATLNLTEVNITGNNIPLFGGISANLLVGGGVATLGSDLSPTRTRIIRSTIANNSAVGGGGGVSNTGTGLGLLGGFTTITNSTITSNVTAAAGGGIINIGGNLNLTNDTISHNSSVAAGGGVVNLVGLPPVGVVNIRNTIVAVNNAKIVGSVLNLSDDVLGVFNSLGNNLIGHNLHAEASFTASVFVGGVPVPNINGDIVGSVSVTTSVIDPKLAPIANNGGPTNTRALLAGSPAIDHANNCVFDNSCTANPNAQNPPNALTTDQRAAGFTRLFGPTVDIGAYELQGGGAIPFILTVNTLSDHAPNGCTPADCTLREAVLDTNANPAADFIVFDPSLIGGTIVLDSGQGFGQMVITDSVSITGPDNCARKITISGNHTSRIFQINPIILGGDIEVNISGVSMINGNGAANTVNVLGIQTPLTPGPGGAILNTGGGHLNLSEVNINNNSTTILSVIVDVLGIATTIPVDQNLLVGGGVATIGTDTERTVTNIARSLIHSNSASGGGGGVSNTGTGLLLLGGFTNITNTTITSNSTLAAGGGLLNAGGTTSLVNDTISDNTSVAAGGGVVNVVGLPPVGVVRLRNTIIARNNAVIVGSILNFSDDVLGIFQSEGHNLIGNRLHAEASFAASVFVGLTPLPNAQLDLVGSVSVGTVVVDPKLGPLADNGGCTDTRAIPFESPALDAGDNCVNLGTCSTHSSLESVLQYDQRGNGFDRRIDGNGDQNPVVDIGAFEVQGTLIPTAAPVSFSGRVTTSDGRPIYRVTVTLTDMEGNVRSAITNSFGYFSIAGVMPGQTYVVNGRAKGYTFQPKPLSLVDEMSGFEFVAAP